MLFLLVAFLHIHTCHNQFAFPSEALHAKVIVLIAIALEVPVILLATDRISFIAIAKIVLIVVAVVSVLADACY